MLTLTVLIHSSFAVLIMLNLHIESSTMSSGFSVIGVSDSLYD